MANIKDYQKKELSIYIVFNLILLIIIYNYFDLRSTESFVETIPKIMPTLISSPFVYIFVFLANNLVKRNIKNKLIFFTHQPGETIFSNIKSNSIRDNRFNHKTVMKKYERIINNIPNGKKEKFSYENSNWYDIYKKHEYVDVIYNSHRDFLLSRDINFITIVFITLYSLVCIMLKSISMNYYYLAYLIIVLLVSNIVTRVNADRFVLNVLACDITSDESDIINW